MRLFEMIYVRSHFSTYNKSMMDNYDAFVKVIKKDPGVQNEINVMLDGYMSLPYDFQSKVGYKSLIQNVIPKELINIMVTTITDLDIQLKMKK